MLQRAYALSASLNKRDSACSLPVAFIHSLCQHEKTRLSKVKCFRGTVAHVESQSNVTYDRQRRGMKSLLRGDHAFPCPRKRIFRQTYIDTMSRCFDSLCHVFSDIVRTAGISLSVALGIFSKDCVSSDHRFVACVVRFVSVIFLPMKKKKKRKDIVYLTYNLLMNIFIQNDIIFIDLSSIFRLFSKVYLLIYPQFRN